MVYTHLAFGDEPPLLADRRRKPDRRQVSLRWLAGTLLTGVTSTALMGIALSAALDGHRGAVLPSESIASLAHTFHERLEKGGRVVATALPLARSRQVVELSTIVREGDQDIISTRPFGFVNMLLAARHPVAKDYPSFDPLTILSGDTQDEASPSDDKGPAIIASQIYGSRVETDIKLKMSDFAFDEANYEKGAPPSPADSERLVRQVMPTLAYEPVQVASLNTVDPFRFGLSPEPQEYEPGSAFRIIEENVSFSPPERIERHPRFYEEIVPLRRAMSVSDAMEPISEQGIEATEAVNALGELLGGEGLKAEDALRVGIETVGEDRTVVRLSAYRGKTHIATVAATRDGPYEQASAPEMGDSISAIFDEREAEAPLRADMPSVYDGIYQAALAYGFDLDMCGEIARMLASEIDLQAKLLPTDRLSVFYSMDDEDDASGSNSDILFVSVALGDTVRKFYRFKPKDSDRATYFDPEGRSARQFLLRKPVTQGRFSSGFSTGRKHPVLGYVRPHWGVDWAAPRGTPILAAANGVITETGWASGYGRHTEIKHANGYVTTYSHQSAIAKGLKVGSRVRQGQVIGYVGSTGLSTGNHLHYEVHVNNKKLDPMRIKVGSDQVLKGDDLAAFIVERDRIDSLINERFDAPLVAAR